MMKTNKRRTVKNCQRLFYIWSAKPQYLLPITYYFLLPENFTQNFASEDFATSGILASKYRFCRKCELVLLRNAGSLH